MVGRSCMDRTSRLAAMASCSSSTATLTRSWTCVCRRVLNNLNDLFLLSSSFLLTSTINQGRNVRGYVFIKDVVQAISPTRLVLRIKARATLPGENVCIVRKPVIDNIEADFCE